MTGMASGIDVDAVVKELMSAQKLKKTNLEGKKEKLSWKQDAWKKMNKKITDFYNGTLSSLRFSDAFSKKTTVVGNSDIASVTTSGSAMNVTQELTVNALATNAYQTGKQLTAVESGKTVSGSTKPVT